VSAPQDARINPYGVQQRCDNIKNNSDRCRLVNDMGVLDDIVAPERDLKKEPQRRDGLIEGRHANAARRQMQYRRTSSKLAVSGDRPRNAAKFLTLCTSSCWLFGANLRIVMSSIMLRRNGLIASSVMGLLLP
jgi:hypothetical protein